MHTLVPAILLCAEKKLKDSESLFRELFNNMSTGVAIYNAVENGKDFIFKDLNKAGLLSSRLEYHEVVGRSVLGLFPRVKEMGLFDVFQRVWETGTPEHYPSTLYQDNRVAMWVENYVCKLPSGELVAIYDDITDRKKAEEEIIRGKEEWERTFNSFTDIVTLQNTDMTIIKINKAGCDTLKENCENIIGKHCYELFHGSIEPCPECPLLVTQETFEPYTKEITHEKLGKTFLVSAAPVLDNKGNLTHIAHVAKDITEKKKIEERLFLNEKLATIAGLAAGVAHEINSPLSAILQSQQMIEMRLNPDKPRNQERAAECGVDLTKVHTYFKNNELYAFMKGIRDSAITAGNIIKNLLEFSRPHKGEIRNATLSNLLDSTLQLARSDYELKKKYDIINVNIVKEYDADLPEVPCVAMEFEQVILNLIKNAVHAMADNNTEYPCITIRTAKTEKMARIEMEDNGPGIDEETQLHIFDPFFTTKEIGQGTGLGLSVSHAILVDRYKGNIWVESESGEGAKFVIELPLVQEN